MMKNCRLFEGMTEQEIHDCLQKSDTVKKSYRKGEILHRGGERFERFGLVLSGRVQVFCTDLEGNQVLMASVSERETFGESHCYLKTKAPDVWVQATENAEVLWISAEKLCLLPEMSNRFTALLATRTLSMNDRIQILSKHSLREKLMMLFSIYCGKTGEYTVKLPFDRNGMATYLGADRSALSRELSKMKQEGLLDYHRNSFRLGK